jgi:SAM-dependent methyltransferase
MPNETHDAIVDSQFGAQARAYLASPVHATGQDLEDMARLIGAHPGARALDLGCGSGHAAFPLAPLVGSVVACDLSEAMLAVVAEEATRRRVGNLTTQQASVEALPFASESFDLVVTRFSAHHWTHVRAGLDELRRVLRPNGLAVVIDAIAPPAPLLNTWLQALELLRDPSHVRNYTLDEWRELLRAAGLSPAPPTTYRLRLDFASWIGRMRTAPELVAAIRALQLRAGAEVRRHFAIEQHGSFVIETMLVAASAQSGA